MSELEAHDPTILRSYEGLVHTTAVMLVTGEHPDLHGRDGVEDDVEDVEQLLRVKVYRALLAYDPARTRAKKTRGRTARDLYVNMCVRDMAKDIAGKKRRALLLIDDVAPIAQLQSGPRDRFDARYLSQSQEETFAEVETSAPLIPNTLSQLERAVLVLLYREYTHREIALRLCVSKGEVSSAVRALRAKLGDWRPAGAAELGAPRQLAV